jgi:hypothetical protein
MNESKRHREKAFAPMKAITSIPSRNNFGLSPQNRTVQE